MAYCCSGYSRDCCSAAAPSRQGDRGEGAVNGKVENAGRSWVGAISAMIVPRSNLRPPTSCLSWEQKKTTKPKSALSQRH